MVVVFCTEGEGFWLEANAKAEKPEKPGDAVHFRLRSPENTGVGECDLHAEGDGQGRQREQAVPNEGDLSRVGTSQDAAGTAPTARASSGPPITLDM